MLVTHTHSLFKSTDFTDILHEIQKKTGALVLHRSPKPQVHIMQRIKQRIKCLHSTKLEAGYCIPQEFLCL